MNGNKNIEETAGTITPTWLEQLVSQAFAKLASPLHNNGMYAELQRLVEDAFNLGQLMGAKKFAPAHIEQQRQTLILTHPGHFLPGKHTKNEAASE